MAQNSNITKELDQKVKRFIRLTLKDIRVDLEEEFDRNFEREAFFNEAWTRRKHNDDESRGLLTQSGKLRRSIKKEATTTDHSVIFTSSVPYAAIHNEGGTITVTRRMKNTSGTATCLSWVVNAIDRTKTHFPQNYNAKRMESCATIRRT